MFRDIGNTAFRESATQALPLYDSTVSWVLGVFHIPPDLEKGKIEDSTYILRSQPKRDHYWVCLNSIGESNHATMPGSKRVRKMKKLLPRDNPTRCKWEQSTYFSRVTGYPCHSIILSFCHYSLTIGELLFKWIYVVQSLNVLTSTFVAALTSPGKLRHSGNVF